MEEDNILLALLKNPDVVTGEKSTFQWIVDTAVPNRNRCRAILTDLKKRKIVKEEPEGWKKGQRKWFSLTEKGKNNGLQLVANNINQLLSILEAVATTVVPEEFRKDYDLKFEELWDRMVSNEKPFKGKTFLEKVEEFERRQAEPAEPMFESLRRLHKILTTFRSGEVDCSQYITVVMGNGSDPLTIPNRLLRGINFANLFFMGQSKNQKLEMEWNIKSTN
jgi:predicted transcriptional regulator